MRKTWVKRENIYFKPFYKDKSKVFMLLIFLVGISFIAYQLPSVQQLRRKHKEMMQSLGSKQLDVDDFAGGGGGGAIVSGGGSDLAVPATQDADSIKIIRGIRLFDYDLYKPNYKGMFKCLDGSREIPFNHLNDNYCDCIGDGSDEPSTNACANGRFYCKYQKRHITGRGLDVWVFTSRVNDNVCDCCDGSDEWITHAKCQNRCT